MNTPVNASIGLISASDHLCVKKRYFLDNEGNLQKDPEAGSGKVYRGQFKDKSVLGLEGLVDLITDLKDNQCLTLGVTGKERSQTILTESEWKEQSRPPGKIARIKECIKWSCGSHFLLLDVDTRPGKPTLSPDEFWTRLITAVPEMGDVGRVVTASTSSHIYNSVTGECLKGSGGHHIYIQVKGDVGRFIELLKVRFWTNGEAFFELSKHNSQTGTASLLERFLLDMFVFSPERLIYETGAELEPGLKQRRPEPYLYPGEILDLDSLPEPTTEERSYADENRAKAEAEIRGTRYEKVVGWLVGNKNLDTAEAVKQANEVIEKCDRGILSLDHVLYFKNGKKIEVKDLTEEHVGLELKDPQEPDYDDGRCVAKVFGRNGFYYINSFAHGKKVYTVEGVDPIITAEEPAGLNRDEKARWNHEQIKATAIATFHRLTKLQSDIESTAEHVNEAGFPIPIWGEAMMISAFTGAGKSTFFKEVKDELTKSCDVVVVSDLLSHRNSLARATGNKMGMSHLSDLVKNPEIHTYPSIPNAAYCIDSFQKRFNILMGHIDRGGKVVLILDEWNAILTHLCVGGTIKGFQRQYLIAALSTLLQAIADGGGVVIGGEAHLSQLAIDALKTLSADKLKVTVCQLNNPNPNPWNIFDYQYYTAEKCKLAAIHKTRELLSQGKKVLCMSGSRRAAEQFDFILRKGYKIKRIDRVTIAEPENKEFIGSINESLIDSGINCLIATPTMGTGIDITIPYFDAVVVYGGMLDPYAVIQMAGRDRNPIDRHVFTFNNARTSTQFSPKTLTRGWEDSLNKALSRHNMTHTQKRGVIDAAVNITAKLDVLENAGKSACHDLTMEMFSNDGHKIIPGELLDQHDFKEQADYMSWADCEITQHRLSEYKSSEMTSIKVAKEIIKRNDISRDSYVMAKKTIDYEKYGDKVFDDDWILEFWCQGKKSENYRKSLDNATLIENPDVAMGVERERLAMSKHFTGTFWAGQFHSEVEAIEFLAELGFLPLVESLRRDEFTAKTQVVKDFFENAKADKTKVKKLLGFTITDRTPPVSFINDLLRKKFFCKIKTRRKRDPLSDPYVKTLGSLSGSQLNGKADRVYYIEEFPDRDELIKRLETYTRSWVRSSQVDRQLKLPVEMLPMYVPPVVAN